MTRTARSAKLVEHLPEPFVDMHAQDALLAGVRAGELARVTTKWGTFVARLRTSGEISRGCVFVPIHWSGEFASEARAGTLVNAAVDPISGEPEFKHTPACVEPFTVEWYAVMVTRHRPTTPKVTWWTFVPGETSFRHEMAGRERSTDWAAWARQEFAASGEDADFLDYEDRSSGIYRAAYIVDERLAGCLYVSPHPELPARDWLGSLFAKQRLATSDRLALLAGRPLEATVEQGPLVCSCFSVRRATIQREIDLHGCITTRQVGDRLRAGSNCGSCLPEIRALLSAARMAREIVSVSG